MKPPPTLQAFEVQLRAVEERLRSRLSEVRAQLHHGGNKGSVAEMEFRRALSRYLPARLSISHGEVIDSRGSRSAQCDLVVVSEQHPGWFRDEEPSVFLVEGVAAAGEIKSVLTTDHLTTAIDNCAKFRKLRPRWGGHAETVGSNEDVQRYYRNPPYFVFAYESQLTIATIGERVAKSHEIANGRSGEAIDGVFVLDKGYVLNFGYGNGAFMAQGPDGKRLKGFYHDDTKPALLTLMQWLPTALALPASQLPVILNYLLADPENKAP